MIFRMVKIFLISGDLWKSKVKVKPPKNWGTLSFQSTIDIQYYTHSKPTQKEWAGPPLLAALAAAMCFCCYQTAVSHSMHLLLLIIIMSFTPVWSSYEDIGGALPCNQVIICKYKVIWDMHEIWWSTIKSLLHSSPPSEQLSPSISQPLANSLASFFHQKIVALKESISLKLLGSNPSPFDFDQPHCNELLSDFMPVTPLRFQNYSSLCLTNHRNLTTSQPHYWSHVRTFSPSSFHIWQTYLLHKLHSHRNSNLHSSRHFWKSLAYRSPSSRTSGLFHI